MAEVVIGTIRIADLSEFRLFVWELRMLADEMRVGADPYAERLERALDRFTDEPEDNRG
jgi:hypothetical protein